MKKIGVVLSSGGSKGIAHIGFLKVLDKYNIPINRLNGCSAGAFIAALYASGMSGKEIETGALNTNWKKIFHRGSVIPSLGWVNRLNLKRFFKSFLRNKKFSDLEYPLDVVVSDLKPNLELRSKIINKGNVVNALMASISVPFFVKPVKINSEKLFDGGVLDPLPIDFIEDKVDRVIASSVYNGNLINQKNKIITVYTDLGNLSWLDYSKVNETIKLGEIATKNKIREIKKLVN
ncbi:MAG: patatin-like phospholipase family protein [Nanoarchaeota archaeon]